MWMLSLLAAVGLIVSGRSIVGAQDASPTARGGALADYPGVAQIDLTLTDGVLAGVPAETEAGWHYVTLANNVTSTGDPFNDAWSIDFVLLPEGMAADDLAALMEEAPDGDNGTPAGEMASPEA